MKAPHVVRPARTSASHLLGALSLGAFLLCLPVASAQSSTGYPTMRGNSNPNSSIPSTGRGIDPSGNPTSSLDSSISPEFSREVITRREAARKLERKRRMVDSANRLLALTEQLRAELATREPTPDDAKRLDDIARLARSVKDQMRD